MIRYRGIWLPDGEQHLQAEMDKSPEIDGIGTYQFSKLEMALGFVRTFQRAGDVGAHCGMWSRILAQHFDHIEAFEPMPAHAECFALNIDAPNVTLHRCALGVALGEAKMVAHLGNSGHSHLADRHSPGSIRVPVRTLDSFELPDLGFLKIDVEGTELDVLHGAVETLNRCRPTIIVEQKPGNGSRYGYSDTAALRFLEKLGAKIVAQKAGDYVLVWM